MQFFVYFLLNILIYSVTLSVLILDLQIIFFVFHKKHETLPILPHIIILIFMPINQIFNNND